nr:hypothetical protein [uncultured bacterium]
MYPIIKINNEDITVRKLPNCSGERPKSPFLIKIKELPQVSASRKRKNHFFCSMFINYNLWITKLNNKLEKQ